MLSREHMKKQALQDINDIFLDALSLPSLDETKPLMEQLIDIEEKVSNQDLNTNAKLLEWSNKKFQNKVNEKISGNIALIQVALATKVENVKKVLENIFSLHTKLCNSSLFTQESRSYILRLERHIDILGTKIPQNLAQSEKHFNSLLQIQSQPILLTANEANIRAKITRIQVTLTPHMEILHKELGYAKTVLKKDPNIFTLDGLVHLATELAIQIKLLDVTCENWNVNLKIILKVHKYFLDKHIISVQPIHISVQKGENKIKGKTYFWGSNREIKSKKYQMKECQPNSDEV